MDLIKNKYNEYSIYLKKYGIIFSKNLPNYLVSKNSYSDNFNYDIEEISLINLNNNSYDNLKDNIYYLTKDFKNHYLFINFNNKTEILKIIHEFIELSFGEESYNNLYYHIGIFETNLFDLIIDYSLLLDKNINIEEFYKNLYINKY